MALRVDSHLLLQRVRASLLGEFNEYLDRYSNELGVLLVRVSVELDPHGWEYRRKGGRGDSATIGATWLQLRPICTARAPTRAQLALSRAAGRAAVGLIRRGNALATRAAPAVHRCSKGARPVRSV